MSEHESVKRHMSDAESADAVIISKKRRGAVKVAESDPQFTIPNKHAYFYDIADARKYSRGSHFKLWFAHRARDGKIHKWLARVFDVVARGKGCAVCRGLQLQRGVNDIATTDERYAVANEIAYFENNADLYEHTRSSHAKVWFVHQASDGKIHRWLARVCDVVARGQGCAVCRGLQLQRGVNDIATTDKRFATPNDDAYFENNTDVYKYTRSSSKKVWFAHRARDGKIHKWIARVSDVVAQGYRCPECAAGRGERLFCALLEKAMLKCAAKVNEDASLISTSMTGNSGHDHKFDFLLRFQGSDGEVRQFGGEYDGAHHFPNDGAPYGYTLRVSFTEQRKIDCERNSMVDFMVRIPSANMMKINFDRLQDIADSLAAAAAKAFFAGESGLIMHPASAAVYSTTYSKDVVDRAVDLFKRYATQHFASN